MRAAILLAADLLERATDTRLGDAANEMAAWRFEQATREDGAVRSELLGPRLLDDAADVESMDFGSWIWLLGWRQRQGAQLDEALVYGLDRLASSVDRRLRLRVVVGRDPTLNAQIGVVEESRHSDIEPRLPSDWLRDQVLSAARRQADPFELTRHLLQIGTDLTLEAVHLLLTVGGEDQESLRREVRDRFSTGSGLDEDQSSRWLSRLGLD